MKPGIYRDIDVRAQLAVNYLLSSTISTDYRYKELINKIDRSNIKAFNIENVLRSLSELIINMQDVTALVSKTRDELELLTQPEADKLKYEPIKSIVKLTGDLINYKAFLKTDGGTVHNLGISKDHEKLIKSQAKTTEDAWKLVKAIAKEMFARHNA